MGLHRSRIDFERIADQPIRLVQPATLKFDQAEQMERLKLFFCRGEHQAAAILRFLETAGGMRAQRAAHRVDQIGCRDQIRILLINRVFSNRVPPRACYSYLALASSASRPRSILAISFRGMRSTAMKRTGTKKRCNRCAQWLRSCLSS